MFVKENLDRKKKVETRKDFRFYYFWLYFVYQNFHNGYFRISLFTILFEVICGKSILQNSQENASACNFIKKETLAQVFSCEFCEISKNTFS